MEEKLYLNNQIQPKVKFINKNIKQIKNIQITFLGIIILFFSIIGMISSLKKIYRNISDYVNHSVEKEKLERYILPVLMFDPIPFDDIKTVDQSVLLRSSIWAAVINNGKQKYFYEKYNSFLIPSSDVDSAFKSLFGDKIKLKHRSFSDESMNSYMYDLKSTQYSVPIYTQVGLYSPQVKYMKKNKNIYILTVGYIRSDYVWQKYIENNITNLTPDKYMDYILKKTKSGYNIISIKDSPLGNNLMKDEIFKEDN